VRLAFYFSAKPINTIFLIPNYTNLFYVSLFSWVISDLQLMQKKTGTGIMPACPVGDAISDILLNWTPSENVVDLHLTHFISVVFSILILSGC
jgi:hypothetical protein